MAEAADLQLYADSKLFEVEVLVESKDGLLPEQYEGRMSHLLDPSVDQADRVSKSTENVKAASEYLRLRSLLERWVLVRLLVVAKECLTN